MLYLRCTKKLLKRMKGPDPLPEGDPGSSNKLGDWYANVKPQPFRGKSVVIFTNQKTLLTVFVAGYGNRSVLPEFLERTRRLFLRMGISEEAADAELREMNDICLQPTESRSTLGSMNDIARHIRANVEYKYPSPETTDWDREEDLFTEFIHHPLFKSPMNIVYPKDLVKEILG